MFAVEEAWEWRDAGVEVSGEIVMGIRGDEGLDVREREIRILTNYLTN